MRGLAKNRLVGLLLGLWVGLAPAFAAFPAAAMALEMSLAGASGPDCCEGCQPDEVDCDICTALCRLAAQVGTPHDTGGMTPATVEPAGFFHLRFLMGRAPPPDPAPPKPVPHI